MTPLRVWVWWVAANVAPSLVVSALLAAIVDTLGVNWSVVVAYVLWFGLVAAFQSGVWLRWRSATSAGSSATWGRWAGWTVAALIIAMFFGVGIVATLDGLGHERLGLIAGWTVAGCLVGGVQAATLGVARRWGWWWVTASVAGWMITAAAYPHVADTLAGLSRSGIVRWMVGGLAVDGNIELAITAMTFAVYGALTGIVLARLAARPATSAS
jgi:hypothetical protein